MYHIHVVPLPSPHPTSLGVLCRKVCLFNNNIQQSMEVTSASKVASSLGHLLTMDEAGESVPSCLRFLWIPESCLLGCFKDTAAGAPPADIPLWSHTDKLWDGDGVSPVLSHKHHSRTGEPAASAKEQATGHGANEDILSFIKRIAPLLSPNDISIVTHRKGSGGETSESNWKYWLCYQSYLCVCTHQWLSPNIFFSSHIHFGMGEVEKKEVRDRERKRGREKEEKRGEKRGGRRGRLT